MESSKSANDRKLTAPITFRLYEDNFSYLQGVSNKGEVPIREFFREFVDEAVQARLNPPADSGVEIMRTLEMVIEQNRLMNERYEELVKKYEQLAEREAKVKQGLVSQLREFGGILNEALASAIGARRLVWNYVAFKALKESNCPESQIRERLDAENKAWNAERDETIDAVKRIIRTRWPA